MKKIFPILLQISVFYTMIGLLGIPAVQATEAQEIPKIDAKAYVLMDYNSGYVLAAGNPDGRLDPASLTKIMSSYVIGQAIKAGKIQQDDLVTVGKNAWVTGNPALRGSSLMFIKAGEQVRVSDLNRGIVIQSGNDASIALADFIAGSQNAFVGLMNNYAAVLSLKNTHFMTVHGLDTEGQYSTAYDMALLSQALIRDVPNEYALHKEKEFTFNKIRQINRNRLLWSTNLNVDGLKTGYTSGAGHNLVASATDGSMRLISVVLGAPSDRVRFNESEKLLSWGFNFYETAIPIKAGNVFVTQKVWFGEKNDVSLGVEKDAAVTIPKGQMKKLKVSYKLHQATLEAPLIKNQVVGTINFHLDGKIIGQHPLVAMHGVTEGNFFSRIWDLVMLKLSQWFGGGES